MGNTFDGVRKVLEEIDVKVDGVNEDTRLKDDLGMDSFDRVEFMIGLEELCNIDINETHAENWITVGDVVKYIDELKVNK